MPELFDIFRENEAKLHERPGNQAWQKLEARLEKRARRRRHRIRFLQLGAVALAVLMLLVLAVLVWKQVAGK